MLFSCRKDKNQPRYKECECEINSESEAHFGQDAIYLAQSYIRLDSTSQYYNEPIISQADTRYYLGKLSAIFNVAQDSGSSFYDVVFKYDVHHVPKYSLNKVSIWFPPDDLIIRDQFVNTPGSTDNDQLNEFYDEYGFNNIQEEWTPKILYATSEEKYNIQAFVEILSGTVGIDTLYPFAGGPQYSSKITSQDFVNYEDFTFTYAWDNNQMTEFYSHSWKFRVDKACTATFVNDWGDDLPE